MRNLANYALFQGVWAAAVWSAVDGGVYTGLLAALGMLAVHLAMVRERGPELAYVLAAGAVGTALDSALHGAGWILYPTSEAWTLPTAPPWIAGLWLAFAMLPRFSLRWLRGRTVLAIALGAVGGPLSFLAGERLGAIAPGSGFTWAALAVEYAVLTPLLLRFAPTGESSSAELGGVAARRADG
ncbi:MAG: DUF2878 domain-containing protein [Planctomycetota bacterium]